MRKGLKRLLGQATYGSACNPIQYCCHLCNAMWIIISLMNARADQCAHGRVLARDQAICNYKLFLYEKKACPILKRCMCHHQNIYFLMISIAYFIDEHYKKESIQT